MGYELKDLEEKYELELDRIVAEIEGGSVKSVLLQLPDGLKPYGLVICDYISEKTGVDVRIYLGDCFGACDLPDSASKDIPSAQMASAGADKVGNVDLVVQFGHAPWKNVV